MRVGPYTCILSSYNWRTLLSTVYMKQWNKKTKYSIYGYTIGVITVKAILDAPGLLMLCCILLETFIIERVLIKKDFRWLCSNKNTINWSKLLGTLILLNINLTVATIKLYIRKETVHCLVPLTIIVAERTASKKPALSIYMYSSKRSVRFPTYMYMYRKK